MALHASRTFQVLRRNARLRGQILHAVLYRSRRFLAHVRDSSRTGQGGTTVARNIRSPQLETRTGRLKLPKRGKPYWVRLARGLSLGYRRIDTAGPWIVRKA